MKPRPWWHAIRDFVKHDWRSLVWGLALVGLMQLIEFHGWLAGIEGGILDLYVKHATRTYESKAPIIIVEIDDSSYSACFRGTSPMDADTIYNLLSNLIGGAGAPHPKVIGVDILTDSDHQNYEKLRSLSAAKEPQIIWTAPVVSADPHAPSFRQWIFGAEDEFTIEPGKVLGLDPQQANKLVNWAVPAFPTDEDLRLRRFPIKIQLNDGAEHDSWAAEVASHYPGGCNCNKPGLREVIVTYSVKMLADFTVNELFACALPSGTSATLTPKPRLADFQKLLAVNNPIVLVGGTFANARDEYPTSDGLKPGLYINAYALHAQLAGQAIREASRPLLIVLDLIVGTLIAFMFSRGRSIRGMMWRSVFVLLGAICFSLTAFLLGYVWLSVIGIAIGFMPHLLLEIYQKDPKVSHLH